MLHLLRENIADSGVQLLIFPYAEKAWWLKQYSIGPSKASTANCAQLNEVQLRTIIEHARRCDIKRFSCGLEGYPCITDIRLLSSLFN
jgi:hypothetical protein